MKSADVIYFLQAEELKHVKIGYSTRASLIKRLKQHQTGSPDTLVLLAVSLGGRTEEAKLHKTFHNFRLHGEWLKYNDELEHHINNVQKHKMLMDKMKEEMKDKNNI